MKKNKSLGHTLKGYIKKYGKIKGQQEHYLFCKQKSIEGRLEWYIDKYGLVKGKKLYNNKLKNISRAHKITGYIDRYGKKEGIKKWEEKCKKISKANRKIPAEKLTKYKSYKKEIELLTNRNIRKYGLANINMRSRNFHVDHKYSIYEGFTNNVPEKIISNIYNLEIMLASKNCKKQHKSSMTLKELLINVK